MSLRTQAKVLRALDEHRFEPVGAAQSIQVDARVIAATNKNLEKEIERGNFREDLFYRLNVIPFTVPPLRERADPRSRDPNRDLSWSSSALLPFRSGVSKPSVKSAKNRGPSSGNCAPP